MSLLRHRRILAGLAVVVVLGPRLLPDLSQKVGDQSPVARTIECGILGARGEPWRHEPRASSR